MNQHISQDLPSSSRVICWHIHQTVPNPWAADD